MLTQNGTQTKSNFSFIDTVEALLSDQLGNSEKRSQQELVVSRMGSRKRPHDETIESGRLQELLS